MKDMEEELSLMRSQLEQLAVDLHVLQKANKRLSEANLELAKHKHEETVRTT